MIGHLVKFASARAVVRNSLDVLLRRLVIGHVRSTHGILRSMNIKRDISYGNMNSNNPLGSHIISNGKTTYCTRHYIQKWPNGASVYIASH